MSTPEARRRQVKPLTAIRLVAKRELNTRLRTRSFLVGTAVILIVAAGYFLLQATLLSNSDHSRIGLTGQATGISDQLKAAGQQVGKTIDTVSVKTEDEGRQQVEHGDLYALLSGSASDLQVYTKSDLDAQIHSALDSVAQQQVLNAELLEAHLDGPQVLSTAAAAHVNVTSITAPDPDRDQRLIVGGVMAFLLYLSITTYGNLVAQGVVEEKSSRVVEILLSTVRPWHLMLGKVLGLGLTGLIQLVILAGAGLGMASASGTLTISGVGLSTVLWGLLWYILGFFLYATVFAAAGSLVSRQEEAQSVLTPVTMILAIGFVVGLNLMVQSPDGSATTVLSLIPLLSPVLMPGRIAAGLAPGWQIGLSILLTVALIGVLTWLAGRIYRNAVLRTGSRVRLRDALRS